MTAFRDHLDRNLFTFLACVLVVLLLWFVPQIHSIWWELPVRAVWESPNWGERGQALFFTATVLFLIVFYGFAWRAVASDPGGVPYSAWKRPLRWLAERPVVLAEGLGRAGRRNAALICLALGLGLLIGENYTPPRRGLGAYYAGAGMTALDFGWELLLAAAWFAALARHVPPGQPPVPLGRFGRIAGRFLALILTTTLFAEAVWVAACYTEQTQISFRVYTIWGVFQFGFLITITAHLLDVGHQESGWPVRQLSLCLLAAFLLVLEAPSPVAPSPAGQQQDLGGNASPDWYEQLEARLAATDPDGPVVLVSASGGGSRAALFAALVLEGMRREKLTIVAPDGSTRERTWADQLVMISSVSGGSLAAAYYANDAMHPADRSGPWSLRNSFQRVLAHDTALQAEDILKKYYHTAWDAEAANRKGAEKDEYSKRLGGVKQVPVPKEGTAEWEWIVGNHFADDMCTDFMAPLLRGFLTPGLRPLESFRRRAFIPSIERGTSLSRFWEDRFGWGDCDNLHGYGDAGYAVRGKAPAPLVLFNATDARRGSRFVVGFPPLPRSAFVPPDAEEGPLTGLHGAAARPTGSLADFWPRYRVSLAEAVRMSANFPWGLHTARLSKEVPVARSGKLEAVRAALVGANPPLAPLFPDKNTLLIELAKDQAKDEREAAVTEALRWLDAVRVDQRLPEEARARARQFLDGLRKDNLLSETEEVLDLLDGGVNDNTGLPTMLEVIEHLDQFANRKDGDRDKLLDKAVWEQARDRARGIMGEFRRRGVILVEIDSGAKVSSREVGELQTPAQGLEAAGQSLAVAARIEYLGRLNVLLKPDVPLSGSHPQEWQRQFVSRPAYQALRRSPMWLQTFVCNHDRDDDVMTAWALAPSHKTKILATYFCEYRQWTELENPDLKAKWLTTWTEFRKELERRKAPPALWPPWDMPAVQSGASSPDELRSLTQSREQSRAIKRQVYGDTSGTPKK